MLFPLGSCIYSHRATARSEMERSGIELARVDAADREATARSEMERSGIELARVDATDRKVPSIPSR